MSGATKHFYADEDVLEIIKRFNKGEISRICNKAIKEFVNLTDSLEKVKENLDLLYQEQNLINSKISFLEKRKIQLEEIEKVKTTDKLNFEESQEKKKKDEKISFLRSWVFQNKIEEGLKEEIETLIHFFADLKNKTNEEIKKWKYPDFSAFLKLKGFQMKDGIITKAQVENQQTHEPSNK